MKQPFRTLDPNYVIAPILYLATFALYVATLAPSIVPGDPAEYQFIPHILGIAHPPGYAFFTILAKLWTSVVRVGSVAYRSNLLAAAAGAWTALMVYGIVWTLGEPGKTTRQNSESVHSETEIEIAQPQVTQFTMLRIAAALFAATILATSADLWQHSIHANAHIVSAALAATTLWCGLRWWATGRDRWLYAFAFLAALGVTHHPLLAIAAPAYVVFVLAVDWRLLLDWRRLGAVALALLLGLSPFLYLPLRAGATSFGPSPNMDALIGHATARGIRVNLFPFGLGDQPMRLRVFFELLELQFAPLALVLAVCGLFWLAWRRPRPFLLLGLSFLLNLAFIINTVQDVMAYLLLPFTTTAALAGAGVLGLIYEARHLMQDRRRQWATLALVALVLFTGPVASAFHKAPRLSLRRYRLADEWINAVFEQFDGKREGAILLAPWEALTPLYYAEFVEGRALDPADVRLVFVAAGTANPWLESVWQHIEDGPIYLADYRPQVVAEGFRLRPVGDWPLYKLESPPATRQPEIPHPFNVTTQDDAIEVLGYDLDRTTLQAGETAYLTLYMRSPIQLIDYYAPYLWLGDRLYRWTTDSRLNTPWWQPGEIIVERYAVTVPFGTPPGEYPLAVGVSNLSLGKQLMLSNGASTTKLPETITVERPRIAPSDAALEGALANVDSRIVLLGGHASARGQRVAIPWSDALEVYPGDEIEVWLDWQALKAVDHPYTVFVHLIDGSGRPVAQRDYTPMGGAFPTFLWIPRWFEGQRVLDPYRLTVPRDAPVGDYMIEIGLYGMTDLRRAYHFDSEGNLAGDRYILGPVRVGAP